MDLLEAMTRMNAEANVADPSEYHLQPISDGWSVLVLPPSSEPQARFASTVQWEQPNTLALGLALYICWMAWRRKGSRLRAVAHIGTCQLCQGPTVWSTAVLRPPSCTNIST